MKWLYFYAFFAISFIIAAEQPAWDENLDFDTTEYDLQTEEVVSLVPMKNFLQETKKVPTGTGDVRLATLQNGLKAVFKTGNYAYGEVAAYKASKAIGRRLVPPTILRTIKGIEGSLQFFVDSPIDLMKVSRDDYLKKLSPKDQSDMILFYFLFGQWDTHPGNQIIAKHKGIYYLALIDNAGIRRLQHVLYGSEAFLEKGSTNKKIGSAYDKFFPFHKAQRVKTSNHKALHAVVSPFAGGHYIHNLRAKFSTLTYVLWRDSLWIKQNKKNYTSTFFASTLEAIKRLDTHILNDIWSDYKDIKPKHVNDLIKGTLERRDQLLEYASKKGHIIDDLE